LPAGKGGQQQGAFSICTENVQLWHPYLAKGDTCKTFEVWYWGLFDVEISIMGSKKTLNILQSLLNSQPSCGIIRTTADYFLLPYSRKGAMVQK
jgi:hypothetical protein